MNAAADRHCAGVLQLRPTHTGLHAVADLPSADAAAVTEAFARGVEVMPISEYAGGRQPVANGLMIEFAAVREAAMDKGMETLAAALDATLRATWGAEHGRRAASRGPRVHGTALNKGLD